MKLLYVVLPQGVVDSSFEDVMRPFNFNVEMPEYEKACMCLGVEAHEAAVAAATKMVGDLQEIKLEEISPEAAKAAVEKRNRWWDVFEKALSLRRDTTKALESCELCGGTGTRKTTFNYRAFWNEYEYVKLQKPGGKKMIPVPNCVLFQKPNGEWDWAEGDPTSDHWVEMVIGLITENTVAVVHYT